MTLSNASAAAMGLIAALGIGIWVGTTVGSRTAEMQVPPAVASVPDVMPAPAPTLAAPTTRTVSRPTAAARAAAAVPVSAPELHKALKPLMYAGTDMTRASKGFRSAEQFATLAHAAHNTAIPFVVLKDAVLNEKRSLVAVIAELKPDLNAAIEANRARAEGASDISRLQGDL